MKGLYIVAVLVAFGNVPVSAATIWGDSAACSSSSPTPAVLAWFDGLKDRKGQLRLELFPNNDDDFLEDDFVLIKAGKAFRRVELNTPATGPVAVCIRAPRPGVYSLALIHDRDGKRKFSFSVDGVGFPGDPKLGWSKPKASKAAVTVGNGVTEIHVTMKYFSGLGFSPVKHR